MSFALSPEVNAGAPLGQSGGSSVPTIMYLGQAQGVVVVDTLPPDLRQTKLSTLRLYRAFAAGGPWTKVDERNLSARSRWSNLFDVSPNTSSSALYAVTAVDTNSVESAQSLAVAFAAFPNGAQALTPGPGFSQGVFGQDAVLGTDVYLNPITREAVIGLNGDLMYVTGLECLAQDLRTRITTEKGELLLHQDFGNGRARLIGSGQSDPSSEAQILYTRLIDTMLLDPRVDSIIDVSIARSSIDAWDVNATIIAIGSEDPRKLNLVVPFF